MSDRLRVGQLVEDQEGRVGYIRYIGRITAAPGDFVGIELDQPAGKNDGAVKGQRYFACEPLHGLFVRPTAVVRILEEPAPGTAVKDAAFREPQMPQVPVALDFSVPSRIEINAARRTPSVVASPTPSARSQASESSQRSAVRGPSTVQPPSGSGSRASAAHSRAPTPVERRFPVKPLTQVRPDGASTRSRSSSIASSTQGIEQRLPATTVVRSSVQPRRSSGALLEVDRADGRQGRKNDNQLSISSILSVDDGDGLFNPRRRELEPDSYSDNVVITETTTKDQTSRTSSTASRDNGNDEDADVTPRAPRVAEDPHSIRRPSLSIPAEALKIGRAREIEALVTKIKIMERRRLEDRVKLQALEQLQAERDRFENVIQKLQTKIQPQQQELTEVRKQLRESQDKLAELENSRSDHDSAIEMATLDREMAEETAEALRADLESLKARIEELDEEVELLREEHDELGNGVNEHDRTSHGWLQLEKSNERLKEALLRLREMTQAQEAELKNEVKTLQNELKKFSGIEERYQALKLKVEQSDAIIEDLKQQLELAAGAEEMLEELTGNNLTLTEQLDALKVTVEDLESLKELNDELEVNHLDVERQLQAELDRRDSLLAEYEAQSRVQTQKIFDQESTIVKFRQLVTSLQAHLEDLKSSKNLTQTEADELNMRARGLIETNAKLQSAATRTQLHSIELETVRFQAQEAASVIQMYKSFFSDNADTFQEPLEALSVMRRMSFKAQLVYQMVSDGLEAGEAIYAEQTLECCDILNSLLIMRTKWDTYACGIQHCSLKELEMFRRWYRESLSKARISEQNLDAWLQAIAAGDFSPTSTKESIAQQLESMLNSTSLISNVSPKQAKPMLDLVVGRLSIILTASNFFRRLLATIHDSEEDIGDDKRIPAQILDDVLLHIRQAELHLSKIIDEAGTSISQQHATTQDLLRELPECSRTCEKLLQLLQDFSHPALSQPGSRASNDDHNTHGVSASLKSTSTILLEHLDSLATYLIDASRDSTPQSPSAARSTSALLAKDLKTRSTVATASPVDLEEVNTVQASLQRAQSALLTSDALTAEQALKISLLESRMQDASVKAARLSEVEALLEAARAKEQELDTKLAELERDVSMLRESERIGLETRTKAIKQKQVEEDEAARQRTAFTSTTERSDALTKSRLGQSNEEGEADLATLKAEVNGLYGTIRHLRASEARLLYNTASFGVTSDIGVTPTSLTKDALSWLREPLIRPQSTASNDKHRRRAQVANDLFDDLLSMVKSATPVRLTDSFALPMSSVHNNRKAQLIVNDRDTGKLSEMVQEREVMLSRLAWRPARQKTAWIVAKQREDWEIWKGRVNHFTAGTGHERDAQHEA